MKQGKQYIVKRKVEGANSEKRNYASQSPRNNERG